jgi:very-short-patch-repair endonuclease
MPPVRRQISPHAARLRRLSTDAERKVWSILRNRQLGGCKFRRQATIGAFVVDFLCVEASLIIELDGGQHNDAADARRTEFLNQRGYDVIRFWNNEVNANLAGVLDVIATKLAQEKQEDLHPALSRARERD